MYFAVLDTETTNGIIVDDKLDLSNSLVYDLGYAIVDEQGKVYLTRSFVIDEIFNDEVLMEVAYFKDKIPQYKKEIEEGTRTLVSFFDARKQLIKDLQEYGCKIVSAHNSYFDKMALNNTYRYLTKSKSRWYLTTYNFLIYYHQYSFLRTKNYHYKVVFYLLSLLRPLRRRRFNIFVFLRAKNPNFFDFLRLFG